MTAKVKPKTRPRKPRILRCECEGTLRPVQLKEFDFTQWAGIPVRLETVPGYRCDKCNGETLPGIVINVVLVALARGIIQMSHRLPADAARYLRRHLQITQQELADRMGIARETVAQWECGEKEISPQHDLILRTLLLQRWFGDQVVPTDLLAESMKSLGAVKSDPPPRRRQPLRVSANDYAAVAKPNQAELLGIRAISA